MIRASSGILRGLLGLGVILGVAGPAPPARASSLRGSMSSVTRQDRMAEAHDFSHLRNSREVRKFVDMGLLVRLPGDAHYSVEGASFPYARPAVKLFIERLSRQYHAATGERLVVTSLTRPLSRQPRNASDHSVHPTGMAADIRRSHSRRARRWLEQTLLTLEDRGVLEATRERHPPHYHVAVFPNQYTDYVARKTGRNAGVDVDPEPGDPGLAQMASTDTGIGSSGDAPATGGGREDLSYAAYRVRRGDSLWSIARRHRTTVGRLKQLNAMSSSEIFPGQTLMVPSP